MSRRPATFTEADYRRAIRAGRAERVARVSLVATIEGPKIVYDLEHVQAGGANEEALALEIARNGT